MATHSNILAWKIPWTEEHGGLQFMWLQRVGHNWSNWVHTHIHSCTSVPFTAPVESQGHSLVRSGSSFGCTCSHSYQVQHPACLCYTITVVWGLVLRKVGLGRITSWTGKSLSIVCAWMGLVGLGERILHHTLQRWVTSSIPEWSAEQKLSGAWVL